MKRIKQLKNWKIFELSEKEQKEYNFRFAVIHPDLLDLGGLKPKDTDIECDTLEQAVEWIEKY